MYNFVCILNIEYSDNVKKNIHRIFSYPKYFGTCYQQEEIFAALFDFIDVYKPQFGGNHVHSKKYKIRYINY